MVNRTGNFEDACARGCRVRRCVSFALLQRRFAGPTAHMLQQTNEIFEILTNADQKQKLDANNQQKLNEWILYLSLIHI